MYKKRNTLAKFDGTYSLKVISEKPVLHDKNNTQQANAVAKLQGFGEVCSIDLIASFSTNEAAFEGLDICRL